MIWLFVKLLVRFLVFGAVFAAAAERSDKIEVQPRVALPLVAGVFALLNTSCYWVAKPILNLATVGSLWFVMPFILNALFLYATSRALRALRIDGVLPMVKLAGMLTIAHGVLYLALDLSLSAG